MKHVYALLVFGLILANVCQAQQVNITRITTNDYPLYLHNDLVIALRSGGALNVGHTATCAVISPINATGNINWTKSYTFDNAKGQRITDVVENADSSLVLTAFTFTGNLAPQSITSAYCVKLNPNGTIAWGQRITTTAFGSFVPYAVIPTYDSAFVVCGRRQGTLIETFLAKLSKTGNLLWMKVLNNPAYNHEGFSIRQTPDSGFVIGGYMENTNNARCYSLCKTNKLGDPTWLNYYCETASTSTITSVYDLVVETDGYLALGRSNTNEAILFKTDLTGNVSWSKTYKNTYVDQESFLTIRPLKLQKANANGRLINFRRSRSLEGFAIMNDSLGNIRWAGATQSSCNDVAQLKNKSVVWVGNPPDIISKSTAYFETYGTINIIITDSLGGINGSCYNKATIQTGSMLLLKNSVVPTTATGGIAVPQLPTVATLSVATVPGCLGIGGGLSEATTKEIEIFPNPAYGAITIDTGSLYGQSIQFTLTDIIGKTVFEKQWTATSTECKIDLPPITPSVYFYSLKFQKGTQKGKLMLSER